MASCCIPRPEIVRIYSQCCHIIDMHNQARQFELCLEKHWVTQSGLFCFLTTMIEITITDCCEAYRHHLHGKGKCKSMENKLFASLLVKVICIYIA